MDNKWKCRRCGYEAAYKHCLLRHLRRKNPCALSGEAIATDELVRDLLTDDRERHYKCEHCNKAFTNRVSKCKHKKVCPYKTTCSQEENLLTLLSSMQQEIRELRHHNDRVTITNNITNNLNHQKVHVCLNAFGKEDTSHLTTQFLDRCVRKTNVGLVELLDQLHFGSRDGSNANVRITNRKLPLAEVSDGANWKFMKKDKVIHQMVDRGQDLLQEHLEENQDRIRQQLSESMWEHIQAFFERMEVRDEATIRDILDDVYIMLLNKTRELIAVP